MAERHRWVLQEQEELTQSIDIVILLLMNDVLFKSMIDT